MNNEEGEIEMLLGLVVLTAGILALKKRKRSCWIRPINMRRSEQGDYSNLVQELKDDPVMFFRYTRMNLRIFYQLLDLMRPCLTKQSHRALPPELRLIFTLRYIFMLNYT